MPAEVYGTGSGSSAHDVGKGSLFHLLEKSVQGRLGRGPLLLLINHRVAAEGIGDGSCHFSEPVMVRLFSLV